VWVVAKTNIPAKATNSMRVERIKVFFHIMSRFVL
jgi:hypothetical protein